MVLAHIKEIENTKDASSDKNDSDKNNIYWI
jgi:hypothetical protein